jgi:hypothetical protein
LDDGKGKAESSFVEEGKDCEKGNALGGGRRRNGVHNLKCNFGIRSDIAHAKTCRHAALIAQSYSTSDIDSYRI